MLVDQGENQKENPAGEAGSGNAENGLLKSERIISYQEIENIIEPVTPVERLNVRDWYQDARIRLRKPEHAIIAAESYKTNGSWRTPSTELRGHRFCAECHTVFGTPVCLACGYPKSVLGNLLEFVPCPNEKRSFLEEAAKHLRDRGVDAQLSLHLLKSASQVMGAPYLDPLDVELIYKEVCESVPACRGAV